MLIFQSRKLWLKAALRRTQERFVRTFLSYDGPQLLAALRELGVRSGDSVMLHSAFRKSHGFLGSIEELTDVFIDAVGPDGHLLMVSLPYRTSSLDYLHKGKTFDVRMTPSMMGMVTEMYRRRPEVLRSLHPTHPVLVRGKRADWFVEDHPRCVYPCGPDSPFDRLAAVDGKAVFFNVPFDTFTFFHYLEHRVSGLLPFELYTRDIFEVPVVDQNGARRTVRTHAFATAAIEHRRFGILEEALRRRGLIRERRLGASRILAVRINDSIDCVMDMARHNRFFYDMSDFKTPLRPIAGRSDSAA